MDHLVTFAQQFAQLVRLLEENADVVAQKAALRRCLVAAKRGAVTLSGRGNELVAGGVVVPADPAVTGLAGRIAAHGPSAVVVNQRGSAGDVLAVARWLAGPVTGTVPADRKTVRVDHAPAAAAPTGPRRKSGATPAIDPSTGPRRKSGATPEIDPAASRRSGKMSAVRSGRFPAITGPQGLRRSGVMAAIQLDAAPDTPWGKILATLNDTVTLETATRAAEELVALSEAKVRDGSGDAVAGIAAGLLLRVGEARNPELARVYEQAARRVATPTSLPLIVEAAGERTRVDVVLYVLRSAGEEGAAAVIRRVTLATTLADRRRHFELLIKLPAAFAVLTRMLSDGRWHVARNAADLLGELHANEAEEALGVALGHGDERVRRAAANALARLGTRRAVQSLQGALKDPSPLVRVQVATGLASRKGSRSAGTLTRALDVEPEIEVQLAILAALGRVATPEAVARLVKAAEPDGRLFKKKPVAYRVAAVHALGEARTPAARSVLQSLANDKEREVREAVLRVVVQSLRGESADLA